MHPLFKTRVTQHQTDDPAELAAIILQTQQQTGAALKSLILDQQGSVGHRISL